MIKIRNSLSMANILKLKVSERIQLIEDVWESIVAAPETLPLSGKEKKELDRRLAAYHANPSLGSPWKDIKKRILLKR